MKNKILTLFLLLAVVSINACKKPEKGDTGPAGATGAAGKDGNANVIGTNTVVISSWTLTGSSYFAYISAAGITQAIMDKGTVEVFIQYGTEWWALPDLNGKNSTSFGFSLGKITLMNQNSDGSTPANPGSDTFRVVIISASNMEVHPHTNWKDYNEVKKVLNL